MSMHNEAERLRVLAEKLDPEPPLPDFFNHRVDRKAWDEWNVRRIQRHDVSFIATPGALLGAAVDLFDFALAPKGWGRRLTYYTAKDAETIYEAELINWSLQEWPEDKERAICKIDYVSDAAALIAAMEEI